MNGSLIFVDSSAWIALIDVSDGLHHEARGLWDIARHDRRSFLTSDYVLDETYTMLRRRRHGLRMATAFHGLVESSRLIEVAEIDQTIRRQAWSLFVGYQDKVLSYTDCTSFALMRDRNLLEVFTFDSDFQRVGFIQRPP